ncbi:hypothetical protein [Deferrisoma camini]|uniref:hypothetical protein n=1 Tax=Deferrisoma camini TaxID=1035120 RepID=UPI0004AE581F|nr:hypothetical protein [Deferrisoma camini]NOY45915.1 hypothetical protein [Deltaproteobacteria bacterium]
MKKILALATLGFAFVAFGCAGTQTRQQAPITKQTQVKCPKCGVTFTVGEGLKAYEQTK